MNNIIKKMTGALVALALLQLPVCAEVVKVPAGTIILLKSTKDATSKNRVGDIVPLVVEQDVVINGKIVAKAGAPAVGEVTELEHRGFFGVPMKISVSARRVTMIDSNMISVGYTKTSKGKDRVLCGVVGAVIILLPALIVGGNTTIAAGAIFDATVTSPSEVNVP